MSPSAKAAHSPLFHTHIALLKEKCFKQKAPPTKVSTFALSFSLLLSSMGAQRRNGLRQLPPSHHSL